MSLNTFSAVCQSLIPGVIAAVSLMILNGFTCAQEQSSDEYSFADQMTALPRFSMGWQQGVTEPAVGQSNRAQWNTAQWNPAQWNQRQFGFGFTQAGLPALQDEEANEKFKELHDKLQKLNQEQTKLYQEYYSQLQKQGDYGAAARMWRQQANALDALKYYQDWSQTIEKNEGVDDRYWIGVQSAPLSPDVRAFLGLNEQVGLRIENIIEDSPAAKAQLEVNDVIIAVNDHTITSLADLVKWVNESEGGSIELLLNRKGGEVVVQVVPEKRPEENEESAQQVFRSIPHLRNLFQGDLAELHQAEGHVPAVSMEFWGPAGDWSLAQVDLPQDIQFELSAVGGGDFELTMRSDEEEYTVALNQLSDLPKQMRVYAQAYLHKLRQQTNQFTNWNSAWGNNLTASLGTNPWLYLHQSANVPVPPNTAILYPTPTIYYGDYGQLVQRNEGKEANDSHQGHGSNEEINARLDRLEKLLQEMQTQMSRIAK